jgi:hypothetical protein
VCACSVSTSSCDVGVTHDAYDFTLYLLLPWPASNHGLPRLLSTNTAPAPLCSRATARRRSLPHPALAAAPQRLPHGTSTLATTRPLPRHSALFGPVPADASSQAACTGKGAFEHSTRAHAPSLSYWLHSTQPRSRTAAHSGSPALRCAPPATLDIGATRSPRRSPAPSRGCRHRLPPLGRPPPRNAHPWLRRRSCTAAPAVGRWQLSAVAPAVGRWAQGPRVVRISAPVSVISSVCSNCAHRPRSLVTTVQLSRHVSHLVPPCGVATARLGFS